MGKTVPPAPGAHDDAATAQTLVDIMRRQRERDRRMLRLPNSVAIAAFILAITATFVAWSEHVGWRSSARRSAARTSSAPVQPPASPATRPSSASSAPSTVTAPPSTGHRAVLDGHCAALDGRRAVLDGDRAPLDGLRDTT